MTAEEGVRVEGEEAPVLPPQEIRAVLEALVFASPHPITPRQIGEVLGGVPREAWEKALLSHEVEAEGKTVEQRMDELLGMLRAGESLEFLELFATLETKAEMILTFLALLELIRLKLVKVYQRGIFGAIRVFRPVGPDAGVPQPA